MLLRHYKTQIISEKVLDLQKWNQTAAEFYGINSNNKYPGRKLVSGKKKTYFCEIRLEKMCWDHAQSLYKDFFFFLEQDLAQVLFFKLIN